MTTTTRPTVQESFDAGTVRRLAETRGICLSIFLPDQRPGASTGTHRSVLRQLTREAQATISGASEWLEPLHALAEDEKLGIGGPGLAVFCSTRGVECYRAPDIKKAELFVASHFHLTPLLPLSSTPRDLFILGISRKRMRLCRYASGELTEVPWPEGVAASLDDAEGGRVDSTGNHASSGVSPSATLSVQFGSPTRPDHEGAGHHMTHFFRMVDAGLAPLLARLPLLLGGVAEEIAAYRRAAKYHPLLSEEISGSMEHMTASEIAVLAHAAAITAYFEESAKALAACHAIKDPLKKLKDPLTIVRAASAGRVHRLCVREGAVFGGQLIGELDFAKRDSEDLINAAVAETLHTGGEVFVVRAKEMPDELIIAALRY